jgi:predicted small secreted protein
MKHLLILALLGVALSSLTACNTIRGAGADVANVGSAVAGAPGPYYPYRYYYYY